MKKQQPPSQEKPCHHCEGKGYIELRDCAGEIQRTETCSYCEGKGYVTQAEVNSKKMKKAGLKEGF